MSRSRSLYLILTLVMIAVLSVVFVACNINTGDSCEHEYDYVIKQLPTMDAEGSMTVKCSKCELNEEIIIPSLSDMSTWSWKVESKQSSSCEQGGIVVYTSIRPYGGIVVEINTEARGHVLSDLVAEVPSTCTVHGVKAHKECSECGKYFDADGNEITSLELPLADHKIGDLIAEVPSTCISHGVAAHKECSECGKLFDADGKAVESLELPLADHNFGDLVAKKDSTCSAIGTKAHYVCSVCGVCYDENKENELDDLIIPVKDHKYEEKEILEATCCSVGTKQYTCTECGHVYYEEIAKTDKHTPEVLEGYDATCWSKGLTEGSYCSVCGKILQEQKEIDIEHKYSEEPTETIEATCISEGYKYYTCSLCGDVKVETIVKKEHELEKLEGYDATCTEPGLSDGEICSYCGTITKKQEVIQAEGHTKDNGVKDVEPTCTEAGSMLYTCNDCGETWAYEIPALGHKHETVEGISATCTVPGLSDGEKCSECGEILVAQTVVPALGHDWDDGEIIVQVTCTHRGEISHECSRCDASYIEYINATGHSYSEAWSYDGTNHFHKCDNCDAVSDKTSHKDNNKDHKCDVCGYTMSSCVDRDKNHSCDYCGASMGTHVQAAGKHTCDYCGEVMSAHEGGTATCKESATCTVCGQKYGAKDPANHVGHIIWVTDDTYHQQKYDCCNLHLGAKELHDLNENNVCTVCGHGCKHSHTAHTAGLKATCTEDGHIEYWTCSDCSTKFSDSACTQPVADVKIPAKGHSLGSLVSAKEPNCTEAGYHAYYQCFACSVYFDANRKETTWADLEIVALGHNSDGVIAHKDANCTESGVVGGTYCTRCNDGKAAAETVINALGHNYGDWIVEILASCTEEGTLGHYHCSECNIDFDINKVILTNLVINKVNHTPAEAVRENEQDANCTEKGHYDSVVYCSECGDELSREPNIEIPVKGHSYGDWIAEIPATCGEPGVKGHKDCSVCNKHFDNEGNEIFDLSIAADNTAHVWSYSYDVDNHWSVCANCNATKDSEAHSDADEDGICDICKVDMSIVAIFQFGENGKASHVEGIAFEDNKYSEIYNEYTLSLTGSNAYKDAFDALGNSALKLGASKKTGSISFTVPDDITVVVIYVAKYKNNNTKISINGAEYTVSTSSNDGIYTAYEVDTSSVKSVTLNTISGNTRCMIDKIEFYNKHVCSSKTLTHTLGQSATCTEAGNIEYWSCSVCDKIYTDADCKTELTDVNKDGVVDVKDTVIAALGHNYGADGKCQNEGCTSTANIVYLNTNIWNVDNAWFAVYYWDDNGNYWTEMTVYSENSTVYSAMLPEDISNIIFVRMNENKHDFDWASKDNQSQNITLSDGNSYYVVKDWNGSDDGKSTVILVNSYTLVGTGIFGDEWNANNSANDLLYDAKTGLYTKTYDDVDLSGSFEYKIAINHDWDVSYGWNDSYSSDFMGNDGNFKATLSGESKVTFTLNIFTLKIECNIHTHVWNWKNDTTSHKQVCECGATKNEGEHNYVDGKCECGANDPDNYISVDIADLQDGSSPYIDKQVEFTGTVTKIYTAWNDSYNNMSVIVSDNNGNGVLVFRTTEKLEVCDVVTVKGKFFYYTDDEKPANNKYEIDVGSIVTKTGDNHVWTEANCTDPKTCSVCGKTEGEANGHIDENPKDGICDVCKEDISLQSVTIAYTGSTDNMSGDNDAKSIFGLDDNIFNIYSTKTGNYHVGLNKSGVIRLYKNETSLFNISVSSNYQIVKITINMNNTNSSTLSVKSGDKTITESNCVYEINGSSLVISNIGSSYQDIKSIVVYYREAQSSGGDEHVCAENKIHHEAVSPTCTEDGTIEYWSCSKCDKKYSDEACTKEITSIVDPKIAHSYSESDWIAEVSAKCNEDGEKGHYYCSTCKKNYDIDGKELPSLVISKTGEHTYNDEGICSVCGKNKNESTTVTVNIDNYATNKNWSNGTLYDSIIMDSNITVTATCAYPNEHGQNTGKYYTSGNQWRIYQNETPSLTISANAGYTIVSAKITYAANNDGVLTLNGPNIESGEVVEVNGSSITFGVGNTGDKTNGQARITAIEVVYKSSSSSGGTDTPHTHEWELDTTKGANGYEWSADGSSCIAHAKCSDADCTETTTATASITSEETKSATCKEYGEITYTATFTESWATTQTNVIKGSTYAAHTLTANPAKDATCTEAGNIAYWYCSVCEKYFTDEACTTELTDVNRDGKVDGEDAEIAALGHNYVINKDLEGSVDGYIWNADYTECVANGICSRCDDTTTVKSIAVTINDSDSSPATCKEYSKTVYVAEFDDEATWYCEQRYTVTGTTLADHDYDSDDICKVCHEKDPSKVFYLIGCIDGYDYGCEGDWENLGDYEFADGCVEVIFTKDSYVFVKAKTNSAWYMTDGWLGTDVQSAILYNTNKGLTNANKLFVPGNSVVTFTLIYDRENDTIELSYTWVCQTHNWNDATCTAPKTCSVCGATEGTALGHSVGEWIEAAGTCQSAAVIGHYKCKTCGVNLASDKQNVITNIVGDKNPDNHEGTLSTEWQKDASGHWHVYSCCGVKTDEAAHTPDHEGSATEEYAIKCKDCDYVIEAQLNHTHKYGEVKYTLSEDWSKCFATRTCSGCAEGVDGHTQTATATEINWYSQTVNCTQDGTVDYYLTFAEEDSWAEPSDKVSIPMAALGHNMQPVDGKPANCIESGYAAYEKCSRCEYNTKGDDIPATGIHAYGEDHKCTVCKTEQPKVYLVPSLNWREANARFVARFWTGDDGDLWVDLTDSDNDYIYECYVPVGYEKVIFARMNPATTENNWDNKWSQSADLDVPSDANNCYYVVGWTENGSGWTTYKPRTYSAVGTLTEWSSSDSNLMSYDAENKVWTRTFTNVQSGDYQIKVLDNYGTWFGNASGDNITFNVAVNNAEVTIEFDPSNANISVKQPDLIYKLNDSVIFVADKNDSNQLIASASLNRGNDLVVKDQYGNTYSDWENSGFLSDDNTVIHSGNYTLYFKLDSKKIYVTAPGHTLGDLHDKQGGNCYQDGNQAYYQCECGAYFDADENETTWDALYIPVTHSYGEIKYEFNRVVSDPNSEESYDYWVCKATRECTVSGCSKGNDGHTQIATSVKVDQDITQHADCTKPELSTLTATFTETWVGENGVYVETSHQTAGITSHTMTTDQPMPAVNATCTSTGLKEACYYCSVCEKYFDDHAGQNELTDVVIDIDANNHASIEIKHSDTQHWNFCTSCNTEIVGTRANHDLVDGTCECGYGCTHTNVTHTPAKTANCTESGNDEYYYCSTCKKYFADKDCTTAFSGKLNISALGHDTEGVAWSIGESQHWKVCTRCKEKVDSAAHTYDKEILDSKYLKSEANCSSAAVYYKSCICGAHEENVDNTFTNGDIDSSNHIFSQDWTSDDSKHWHKCTNTNCDAISDEAEHTYSEDDHYCECGKFDPSLLVGTADLIYSYTSNAYSVTGYSGSATSVTIPSYYDDGKNGIHQVTAIGNNAFNTNSNTNISAITLPSSVTTIGNFAFYQSNLTSIDLSNVTSLGQCAFCRCKSLTDVELSSNLTTLPMLAFSQCEALQSIDLSYIDTIGESAFSDSYNLASITIKNGVTIEVDAFSGTKLTSITFVNDDTISTTAFSGLSTLTSITFNISDTTNLSNMLDSIPTAFAKNSIPSSGLTVSFPNVSMSDLGTATQNQNNETCWFDSLINGSNNSFKIKCSGDIVLTYTPAKSAGTCQEPGNIAYFTNSIDSKNYSFSKTDGWVEESNVTIAGAHNWSDATCTAPKTCSLCGATDGEADSNAHNYSSYIADGDGSHTLVCSYDSSHTKTENCYGGEEATCLKKSLCEVCKQYYGSYAEHEYGDWTDEVPATCSASGTKGHKDCTVCSKHFDIDGNEISDLTINKVDDAHKYVAVEGVSNLYKCSYCNKEFKASSTSTWELLTDVSNLKAGSRIIIVGINKEIYYALNTNQKSNNRGASEIKVTTNDDGSISFTISESADANVQIINIVSGTKDGTFAFNVGSGYLYAANSSSNQLKTEEILSDNSSWSISVTSNGVASIIAQGTNTRNVLRFNYNNGTPLINCYSSTSDYATKADYNVYIYIENVTYTYTEICENSENHVCSKDNVLDATCTADGVCSICGRTVEDSKLGHTYDEDDYIYNNDATCQKAGTKTATCGRCGLTDTIEDSEHPITSHVYDKDGNCTYNCGTQCNVVYLDTNMWNADSAWFAARFWNDSGEKWVKMSVYNDNGIYYAFVPADMTKVIFVRMNKDATALSFDSKWNQSQDIELSLVDNKAHYTVFAYGENGANSTISNSYIAAGGISDSDGGLFGTAWNISSTDNPNVLKYNSNSSEPGIYSIFYENVSNAGKHGVKVVVNSSWNVNYGDNGNNVEFTVAAGDNVLITFNFFTKEVKAQVHTTHSYTYTINEDGTHNGICSCGSTISNESHTYAKGYCVCGKLDETYYFPKNIADLSALEDGTKVEFTGTVVKVTSSNNVTVSDGNGNTFYIYNPDTSSLSESIEQCDCITVKGVIGTYNDDKQISAGATITIAAEKNHTISEEWSFDSANHYHVCGICFTHFDESGHADDDNDGKCDKCGNAIGDEGNAGTETGGSDSGDGETATQTNYEYTTTDKLTSGTLSWGDVNWQFSADNLTYTGSNKSNGSQIGSKSNPAGTITFSTEDLKNYNQIIVTASTGGTATISVYLGDSEKPLSTYSLTSTSTEYTFSCDNLCSDKITIVIEAKTKAVYIKTIKVTGQQD